jgi:hypothetical protein
MPAKSDSKSKGKKEEPKKEEPKKSGDDKKDAKAKV